MLSNNSSLRSRYIGMPDGVKPAVDAWLHDNWGAMTAAMDRNDFAAILEYERVDNPEEALKLITGVRPVDDDNGTLLRMAVAGHAQNLNLANAMRVKIGPWNHGMANFQDPFQIELPPGITRIRPAVLSL